MDSEVPLGDRGTHLDPPALQFFVPGAPAAQGSKRHVGRGVMVEMSKNLAPWRQAIAAQALKEANGLRLHSGPLRLSACFWFQHPKAHFGTGKNAGTLKKGVSLYRDRQPDLDKLLRALCDGLVQSGVVRDDGQFAIMYAEKRYGDPGVLCSIQTL